LNSYRFKFGLFIAAVLLLPATWYYVVRIWTPPTRGVDLYPRWYGTRELLLHGRDPYSDEVSREIQSWTYGRPTRSEEDQGRFAYPPYVALLLAPTVKSDYAKVDAFFLWLLLLLSAVSVPCWLRFLRCKPSKLAYAIILLLAMGSFSVIYGALLRQLTLLVAFLVAAAAALLSSGYLIPAGILLALATIKPQLMFLLLLWLLVWSGSDWRARQRLFWSFSATMAVLLGAAFMLLPNWPREFLAAVIAYHQYTDGRSVLQLMFTRDLGNLAGLVVLALTILKSARSMRAVASSRQFVASFALVLTATLVLMPGVAVYNQVLLIPGLLLVSRNAGAISKGGKAARLSFAALWIIVSGQWFVAAVLTVISLARPFSTAPGLWVLPASISILTAPALFIVQLIAPDNGDIESSDTRFDATVQHHSIRHAVSTQSPE